MTEEELKALQEEVTKLRQGKESLDNELSTKNERVVELEKSVAEREAETAVMHQNVTGLEEKLAIANDELNKAVAGYRTLAIQVNPEMPAELINGDSIEAIDNAIESARLLVSKVKEKLETGTNRFRVPAGAPHRAVTDLSGMSAMEKIRYGIGGNHSR